MLVRGVREAAPAARPRGGRRRRRQVDEDAGRRRARSNIAVRGLWLALLTPAADRGHPADLRVVTSLRRVRPRSDRESPAAEEARRLLEARAEGRGRVDARALNV